MTMEIKREGDEFSSFDASRTLDVAVSNFNPSACKLIRSQSPSNHCETKFAIS